MKRLEGESYEAYKIRRAAQDAFDKVHLEGNFIFISSEPAGVKDGKQMRRVRTARRKAE